MAAKPFARVRNAALVLIGLFIVTALVLLRQDQLAYGYIERYGGIQ